jgi:hypothetical protein
MFAALIIPKQHLGYIEDGNSKATLAGQDMRFAKTIERLQRIVVDGLEKIERRSVSCMDEGRFLRFLLANSAWG